jgi:hypothetical protein
VQTKQEMIDSWYEEKKQQLYQSCTKMFEDANPDAEKIYREKMAVLRKKYEERALKEIDHERGKIGKKPFLTLSDVEEKWAKLIKLFNEK